jgi:hypothetical protein
VEHQNDQARLGRYSKQKCGEAVPGAGFAHDRGIDREGRFEIRLPDPVGSRSVQEKSQAEYFGWKVLQEEAQLLQSLGYLPNQSAKFVGEIYHHHDNEGNADPKEMRKEIERIEKIIAEEGRNDPAIKAELEEIKKKLEAVELSQQIKDLADRVSGESNEQGRNQWLTQDR